MEIVPVKWNEEEGRVTSINQEECEHLAKWSGPRCSPVARLPKSRWLVLPEITIPVVPPGMSGVASWARSQGVRTAAIFFDMIPMKSDLSYSDASREAFEQYLKSLIDADIIIPISHTAADDLVEWFKAQRVTTLPQIHPRHLSGQIPGILRTTTINIPAPDTLDLLSIGTWEPRKNFPTVLRAVQKARIASGKNIRITIAGRQMRDSFPKMHDDIFSIANQLGNEVVTLRSQISDAEMIELINRSHATIFGSWLEGFGLPVLESLWQGKPCICHDKSSLGEIAPGGGTVMVDMQSADALADAIIRLAQSSDELRRLYEEAVSRPMRTWNEYAQDVIATIPDIRKATIRPAIFGTLFPRPIMELKMRAIDLMNHSQNGETQGNSLSSNGSAGYLIFGPYRTLPAASYNLKINGTFPSGCGAIVDICSLGKTLFEIKAPDRSNGKSLSLRFKLGKPAPLSEIRIWVPEGVKVSFEDYHLVAK